MKDSLLTPLDEAIAAFSAGSQVIIVDDEDRENEGDLVVAAEHATADAINFMTVHGRGLVCLAMTGALIDRLAIPMMVPDAANGSGFGTAFTVSVEAARGVSTGISAPDRAETIRVLIDPASTPADIAMPGHVFPLRARDGGVLERRGQTEASVDLARLAGLTPAGVICEVMRPDGEMMRLAELLRFAKRHGLPIISVEQIAAWRREHEHEHEHEHERGRGRGCGRGDDDAGTVSTATARADGTRATARDGRTAAARTEPNAAARTAVVEIARSRLPTRHGEFTLVVFRDAQGLEHSALVAGDPHAVADGPLVRLHSECLTGDAFGSLRCDCGEQLDRAMERVAASGHGAILYLRQEGRGIGLGNKIRAYALQDAGADTVEANEALGFPADARRYDVAAAMLEALGIRRLRLMSNNPTKVAALAALGIDVAARVPLAATAQAHNSDYLETKVRRMGHSPDALDTRAPERDEAPQIHRVAV